MSFFGKVLDKATDIAHQVTGIPTADEKRNQQRALADQIKAYRDQTEIAKGELATKKSEEIAQKRRVEEKQIRTLRRNYRAQSFLGGLTSGQPDMTSTLGG